MMNVLGICLVVISVATAGVWSPSPEKNINPGEEIIVKEGHRIIIVEYEKEGLGNTKVSISPQDAHATIKEVEIDYKSYFSDPKEKFPSTAGSVVENAKEKIKEASSVIPNSQPPSNDRSSSPRELICDVIGKCKHKITGAVGRLKEKTTEKVHEVKEEAKKVREKATEVKEESTEAVETVSNAIGEAKEKVSQKAHGIEEDAKKNVDKAKHTAKTAVDKSKTIGEDIAKIASEKLETARQKATEKVKDGKEMGETAAEKVKARVHKIKEEGKNDLSERRQRGREVAYDAVKYVVSSRIMSCLMDVVELFGFCTAYGMCVWITFGSSYILAGALPMQLLGIVQTKIYSVYFRAMAFSIGVALLGHLHFFNQRKRLFSSKAEMLQVYNLVASLLMVVANLNYLEPRATKVIFEKMKVEKEEGRGNICFSAKPSRASASAPAGAEKLEEMVKSRIERLNVRIKKLNSCSSILNILTLMALTWHLVYLAQRLRMTS